MLRLLSVLMEVYGYRIMVVLKLSSVSPAHSETHQSECLNSKYPQIQCSEALTHSALVPKLNSASNKVHYYCDYHYYYSPEGQLPTSVI